MGLDRVLPEQTLLRGRADERGRPRRTWLFVFAIVLHNIPEGVAIGLGFAAPDTAHGTALATGIALQDVPEGLVIAIALVAAGYGRGVSIALGAVSGLVEPGGAVVGAAEMGIRRCLRSVHPIHAQRWPSASPYVTAPKASSPRRGQAILATAGGRHAQPTARYSRSTRCSPARRRARRSSCRFRAGHGPEIVH